MSRDTKLQKGWKMSCQQLSPSNPSSAMDDLKPLTPAVYAMLTEYFEQGKEHWYLNLVEAHKLVARAHELGCTWATVKKVRRYFRTKRRKLDWTKPKKKYENSGVEKAELETTQTGRRKEGESGRKLKPAQSRTAAVRTPLGPCTNTLSQPVTPTTAPVPPTQSGLVVKCKPEPDVEVPMRLVHTLPATPASHLSNPTTQLLHDEPVTHVSRTPLLAFDRRLSQFATDLGDALQASAQLNAQPPRTFQELKVWWGAQTDSLEFLNRIQTGVYCHLGLVPSDIPPS
ncbi:hypothetical protein L226DRAFT_573429 [Lentinus tigrinus ALCF2SS1-7]|uniref:uncharacterized protein n=1 Tax=Lentinus tigrinus ALCF2SS1-7 TaxID=1328758 RepID=UPI001165F31A|nr:hypothetical protein L226DRAFT_573429 [Lentinus tigrinus ALCF2SS1-7]